MPGAVFVKYQYSDKRVTKQGFYSNCPSCMQKIKLPHTLKCIRKFLPNFSNAYFKASQAAAIFRFSLLIFFSRNALFPTSGDIRPSPEPSFLFKKSGTSLGKQSFPDVYP